AYYCCSYTTSSTWVF
nr:immunoglobulin light chain junction region [Macaca mulatta]MOW17379.1 immunoglobulin light chain junction region [Macaca mulatta]